MNWKELRDQEIREKIRSVSVSTVSISMLSAEIDRQIAELHDEYDVPYTALAEQLEMSTSVVRSRYERGKSRPAQIAESDLES